MMLKSAMRVPVRPIPALQWTIIGGIYSLSFYFEQFLNLSISSRIYSTSANTFSSFLAVSSSQPIKLKWSIYKTWSS